MADIKIRIILEGSQFRDETKKVETAAKRLESLIDFSFRGIKEKATAVSFAFNQIQQSVATAARIIEAPLTVITRFETGMANIASLGVPNIEALQNAVLETSRVVPAALDDLANGMYQVVSAGVDAANQVSVLELSAKAARAGLAQTTDALNISSNFIKAYNREWSETEAVLDKVFQTVNLGQTTFPELAASVGVVTPLAATLKIRMDELLGAYATLTGVTGNTSEVSTQLRAIMAGLAEPTEAMSKLIREQTGLSVEQAAAQLGLAGVLKLVDAATGGSAAQMTEYFGSIEAVNAALALSGSQYDSFLQKTMAMEQSAGAMNSAFEKQNATLEAQYQILKNKLDVKLIETGEAVKPVLSGLIEVATKLVETDWTPWIAGATAAATAAAIFAGVTGVAGIIAGLGGLIPALELAGVAIGVFALEATAAIASIPIVGWVAAGISALTALGTYLLLTAKSEKELAQERKNTATETIALIQAEKDRVDQAIKDKTATDEMRASVDLLNKELLLQQKILADANLDIYRNDLREAEEDVKDLTQGFIDYYSAKGDVVRNLLAKYGSDYAAMNTDISEKLVAVSKKINDNRLGLAKVSQDEAARLEEEKERYQDILQYVSVAAAAQKKYNDELAYRRKLDQGKPFIDMGEVVITSTKITNTTTTNTQRNVALENIQAENALAEMRQVEDAWAELNEKWESEVWELPSPIDLEEWDRDLQKQLDLLDAQKDARLVSEETYINAKDALLEQGYNHAVNWWGLESQQAAEYLSGRLKLEEYAAQRSIDIERRRVQVMSGILNNLASAMEGSTIQGFEIGKAAAYAAAIMNAYEAASSAYAQAMEAVPYPYNLVAAPASAALAAAAVMVQAYKISGTRLERRKEGGPVDESGRVIDRGNYGDGENRVVIVNDKEYIMAAEPVRKYGPAIDAMNAGRPVSEIITALQLTEAPGRVSRKTEDLRAMQQGGIIIDNVSVTRTENLTGPGGIYQQPVISPQVTATLDGQSVEKLSEAIRSAQIIIQGMMDGQTFLKDNFPKYDRNERASRLA